MAEAAKKLRKVRETLFQTLKKAHREPGSVRLIGVSKKQSVEKILELAASGLKDFGENYVQEWKRKRASLLEKDPQLAGSIHWHFMGHLQSNKVKDVVGEVDFIHTVDSLKLAEKISQRALEKNHLQKVLLEVNLAGEKSKYGFNPQELLPALPYLAGLPGLSIEGLMAIPPALPDPEQVRPYFVQMKSLLDECNESGDLKKPMNELSMGMSQDFEVALEEGATMIRIGTALFGPRS